MPFAAFDKRLSSSDAPYCFSALAAGAPDGFHAETFGLYSVSVTLVFSTLWHRFFRFGPLDWCSRSLTYWKRRPMRFSAPRLLSVQTAAVA